MWAKMVLPVFLSGMLLLQPVMPWIEYVAFKGYITEHLCINRDNPKSGCNGKCFLEKRLEDVHHEQQQDKNVPSTSNSDITLYTLPFISMHPVFRPVLETDDVQSYLFYSFIRTGKIFRPPKSRA